MELVYSSERDGVRRFAEASDAELLAWLKDDEERALDALIDRKTGGLVQSAHRILHDLEEARDVVQMTFLRVWEKRHHYDPRFSPNTWIYRIATNLAIDQLRSRQSKERQHDPVRWHLVGRAERRAEHESLELEEGEVGRIFRELSSRLSEKQRVAFVLREVEGRPTDEVATILGCRASTVRNHVFNARKILQQAVRDEYPEYVPEGLG